MEKVRLINQNERKLLSYLIILILTFSFWFYLVLSSKDRFALAHGYGPVSEAKEFLGILGIALAFIVSLAYYQSKKTKGFLLITTGLGLSSRPIQRGSMKK